jgi:hypothetical protein
MSVKARFYVSEITRRAFNPDHIQVTLQAAGRGEENKDWAAATPAGQISMTINNPAAASFFGDRLGKDVTLTFEAAEDKQYQSPHQQ